MERSFKNNLGEICPGNTCLMGNIEEVYTITLEMDALLKQEITSENREEIIKQLSDLLQMRASKMIGIKAPFTAHEQEMGDKIIQLNEEISDKMTYLFNMIKSDMRAVKKRRKTNRSYVNPYGDIKSTDGMFLDSKQ